MPEQSKPPSGNQPEGLKPTVIQTGGAPKRVPTVLNLSPLQEKQMTPTVINHNQEEGYVEIINLPNMVKPTILPSSPLSPPPTQHPSTPTTVDGVSRKGVETDFYVLKARTPSATSEMIERALMYLRHTRLDILSAEAQNWGQESIEKHASLVQQVLAGQSDLFQDASKHLNRLYEILSEIDEAFEDKGLKFWKHENPKEIYEKHKREITQLRDLLKRFVPTLKQLYEKQHSTKDVFTRLQIEIASRLIASQYIESILANDDQRKAIFLEKVGSFSKVLASIEEGFFIRSQFQQNISVLLNHIEQGVNVQLPIWLDKLNLIYHHSPNETEIYSLKRGLENLISQMK